MNSYAKVHSARRSRGAFGHHVGTRVLDRIRADLHSMLVLQAYCFIPYRKKSGAMAISAQRRRRCHTPHRRHSTLKRVTDFIADHVDFIAPIYVYPGENELRALAERTLLPSFAASVGPASVSTVSENPARNQRPRASSSCATGSLPPSRLRPRPLPARPSAITSATGAIKAAA